MKHSLLTYLYPTYLIAVIIALILLSFAATRLFQETLYEEKQRELRTMATLARNALTDEGEPDQQRVERLHRGVAERLTVISSDGTVIAESQENHEEMENHGDRREVRDALSGEYGTAVRRSSTTGENTLYVALPYGPDDGAPSGVIRAATSMARLDELLRDTFLTLAIAAALILAVTAFIAIVIIRRVQRPLGQIRDAAKRFARGDLYYRLAITGPDEMSEVAETLNGMAERLTDTIGRISDQRNELEAVLTSMVEGVIVVNSDRRIRSMNLASQRLFEKEGTDPDGRALIEYLRNSELDSLAGEVLETGEYVERTITLYRSSPLFIQVHGTLLRREDDRTTRVLLVLNDITRLKQLEDMRRDFVANVSHELKTPVTAILGFVETLREELPEDPAQTAHFLDIIGANSNRLNLIIEDLLTLSRLESTEDQIETGECNIEEIVGNVLESSRLQAEQKHIQISVQYSGDSQRQPDGSALPAQGNGSLLQQALGNLVDNAVKYSESGSKVEIVVSRDEHELRLQVKDTGQGIPAGDKSRIFERFYRVDRARSRELGGTGLGLAIVKHIALAHRGEVTVDSAEGIGSTFILRIPQGGNHTT